MPDPSLILALAMVLICAVALAALGLKVLKLTGKQKQSDRLLLTTQAEAQRFQSSNVVLLNKIQELETENQRMRGQLEHQEKDVEWCRSELAKRPEIKRKIYKILTLGMKWTGKTSLTLKWANPLTDLGMIEGTKIERYERTVSQVHQKNVVIEHVFEISDWGGEHIVDAQQELIMDEIHGLLMVVDLGGKDAKRVDPVRVGEQLKEFQPQALRFFFGPRTIASCKAVVLFINKSDLIPGTPAEVEEQARRYYQPLVDDLMKYSDGMDVRVLVGSASYGHSTHFLFSHFVEKILPRNAYDHQLLQRMKSDFGSSTATRTKTLTGVALSEIQENKAADTGQLKPPTPAAGSPAMPPQQASKPVPAPAAPQAPKPPTLPRPQGAGATIKLPGNGAMQPDQANPMPPFGQVPQIPPRRG